MALISLCIYLISGQGAVIAIVVLIPVTQVQVIKEEIVTEINFEDIEVSLTSKMIWLHM